MEDEKQKQFEELSKPLIKLLNEKFHPHVTIILTPTGAELVRGKCAFSTTDFVKD